MEQQEAFVQRNRYDRFSVTLHWLMAVLILGQIALGLWMLGLPKDGSGLRASWFNVHKSWGMVLGLLAATTVPLVSRSSHPTQATEGAERVAAALRR